MSRKCHLHGELEEALGCVLVVLGQAERVGELRDVALAYGACLGHVMDLSWTGLVCECTPRARSFWSAARSGRITAEGD